VFSSWSLPTRFGGPSLIQLKRIGPAHVAFARQVEQFGRIVPLAEDQSSLIDIGQRQATGTVLFVQQTVPDQAQVPERNEGTCHGQPSA
jgi:hypothetical protein